MKWYKIINLLIASVWIVNGLFCKVLNLVPRHQQIVARILGSDYAEILTKVIGFFEILMAAWILSGISRRLNVIAQVGIIALMNMIEYVLAPDLLLWGKLNALFAFMFILLMLWNEFYLKNQPKCFSV